MKTCVQSLLPINGVTRTPRRDAGVQYSTVGPTSRGDNDTPLGHASGIEHPSKVAGSHCRFADHDLMYLFDNADLY
jgi:hypothetical protein